MSNLILYADKSQIFECDAFIEGSQTGKKIARLVLEFDNGVSNIIKGTITSDNKCVINIPPLTEKVDKQKGEAILEIIVDSMFFEPYKTNFEIKKSKTVQVESIKIKETNKTTPIIEIKNVKNTNDNSKIENVKVFSINKSVSKDDSKKELRENLEKSKLLNHKYLHSIDLTDKKLYLTSVFNLKPELEKEYQKNVKLLKI